MLLIMFRADANAFAVPPDRFDNPTYIATRLDSADPEDASALQTALRYLYESAGPVNLPRDRYLTAQRYFDEVERVLVPWLRTRTNGSGRAKYGTRSLVAARAARYRCQDCGHPDVRTLNLDHVSGHVPGTAFACLCANCHAIKSRRDDWLGHARSLNLNPPTDED